VERTDLGRIGAFTDGVFAIAITLLVLSLDVPRGDHEITRRVLEQWPDLVAYFLSFAVVGRFWMVHHRFFQTLHRADARLTLLNMLFLSFVVLVPYTTQLLGDHGDDTVAAVVYAAVLGFAGLCNLLLIRHALNADHVRHEARSATEPFAGRGALVIPVVFFGSIPLAFVDAHLAEAMWAALFFIWPARRRRLQRTLEATDTASP
jgi:TMEM175 potassium channel family protein